MPAGTLDLRSIHGARRVIVVMTHTDKAGVPTCTLPLTGAGVVHRMITDLAVVDVEPTGLVLRECAPGVSEQHVRAVTAAPLTSSLRQGEVVRTWA